MADPLVVAARRWIELVERLRDSATLDVDSIKESIDDQEADHKVELMPPKAREGGAKRLFNARLLRARKRLQSAEAERAEIRKLLYLDED